jgi:HPt (histidine-containing phosphotransfer) domain-containing protein
MDFKKMASSLGIDEEEFIELTGLLITTSLADLEALDRAVGINDWAGAAGAAHSIKGAAGNMGFLDLSARAAGIETRARSGDLTGIGDSLALLRQDLLELKIVVGL